MAIPSPGVPRDLPIDIPWSDRSNDVTIGKHFADFWDPSIQSQDDDEEKKSDTSVQFDTSFENDAEKQKG